AIVLREPNNSRARPSTLIKNDEEYKKIFNLNYDVEIYAKCVLIQKKVEKSLKNYKPELSKSVIGDLKFHISMFIVLDYFKKISPNPSEIKNIDIDNITEKNISNAITIVKEIYDSLGSTNKIAKSQDFVKEIFAKLGEIISLHKEALRL